MKRLLSLILAALLLFGACALAEDYSAMSDAQLHAALDAIRNELAKRELVFGENVVVYDKAGVQVYLTGKHDIDAFGDTCWLHLEAVVINSTNQTVTVACKDDTFTVNGWDVTGMDIYSVSPGKKKKASFELWIHEADLFSFEEVEDVEFCLYVYDSDSYDRITEPDERVTVHFN